MPQKWHLVTKYKSVMVKKEFRNTLVNNLVDYQQKIAENRVLNMLFPCFPLKLIMFNILVTIEMGDNSLEIDY